MTTTATKPRTRKNFTPKTSEERQAESKAAHDKLAAGFQALVTSDDWAGFLHSAARFHTYSFNNMMMIYSQFPEATQVAGFRKWQELGRQVRKGEKSIKIFGFAKKTEIDELTGLEVEKVFYPLVSVFDVSQTDVVDEAKWSRASGAGAKGVDALEGEDPQDLTGKLTAYLETIGWKVVTEDLPGALAGLADPRTKTVKFQEGTAPAEKASTLAHETAHIVDGHAEDLAEYAKHKGQCEAIAEGAAFVLGDLHGIDTGPYSLTYIAGWAEGDPDMVKKTAEAVMRTVKKILDAIS